MTSTQHDYQGRKITITDVYGATLTALSIDGVKLYEWTACPHDDALATAKNIIDSDDPRLPELGSARSSTRWAIRTLTAFWAPWLPKWRGRPISTRKERTMPRRAVLDSQTRPCCPDCDASILEGIVMRVPLEKTWPVSLLGFRRLIGRCPRCRHLFWTSLAS